MIHPETSSDSSQPKAVQPLGYAGRPGLLTTGDGARSLRLGVRCWLSYVLLSGFAYAANFLPNRDIISNIVGGLCAIICLTILIVTQIYAVEGFINGCRSLMSETREWRGIAGLIINAAALLPIPCALFAAKAFG